MRIFINGSVSEMTDWLKSEKGNWCLDIELVESELQWGDNASLYSQTDCESLVKALFPNDFQEIVETSEGNFVKGILHKYCLFGKDQIQKVVDQFTVNERVC